MIPLRLHVAAVLDVPFPMTEGDWGQLMAVLNAMKPGIVKDPDWGGEGGTDG